jgi:hypothetical protein
MAENPTASLLKKALWNRRLAAKSNVITVLKPHQNRQLPNLKYRASHLLSLIYIEKYRPPTPHLLFLSPFVRLFETALHRCRTGINGKTTLDGFI